MKKSRRPAIGAERTVHNFREMISHRRLFCSDDQYLRMPDVFETLTEITEPDFKFRIKRYSSGNDEDKALKASVIAFNGQATLTVSRRLYEDASNGCLSSNFTLAHEFAHLVLGHHGRNATTMHFQTTRISGMNKRVAPDEMELETDYAAVFFLCGVALLNRNESARELARRACCDVYQVEKALKICRLEPFLSKLRAAESTTSRIVL